MSRDEEHQNRLNTLVEKIGDMAIMPVSTTFGTDDAVATQVYQMATRVSFIRASMISWKQVSKLESLISRMFVGPLPAHACGHFFPVSILACEAQTDELRTAIINILDRAERSTRLKIMRTLKSTFQSIWAQQDLYADSDLLPNYLGVILGLQND